MTILNEVSFCDLIFCFVCVLFPASLFYLLFYINPLALLYFFFLSLLVFPDKVDKYNMDTV